MTILSVADLEEKLRARNERGLLEHLDRLPEVRYWWARVVLALEVLVLLVAVSFLEDRSLTAQAIEATGGYGWVLLGGAGVCCVVLLLDVFINDGLPARFSLPIALKWRHVALLTMALQLAAVGMLVVFAKGFTMLLLAYWLNAGIATVTAFLDVFARYPRRGR